ncbi:unnamed protein product [Sympodiomycopsis kandeliae]
MDALLSSLHALSLLPPSPSQLLQLLSNASSQEEEDKDVRDLARVLSLGSYDPQEEDQDDEASGAGGFGIDRELIEDAVIEMIRAFKKEVASGRAAYASEEEASRSEKPTPLPKATPLRFLKLRHESALRHAEKVSGLYGGYRPRVIFSGGPSYSSAKEVRELSPVTDRTEASLGQRLDGRYLVGKVASSISVYVGATFLLTLPEPFGFSIPVAISHLVKDPSTSSEQATNILPPGTLILIKEPYFSPNHALRASGTPGGVGIRIDTPTDIVILASPEEDLDQVAGNVNDWRRSYVADLKWVAEPEPPAKGKGGKKGQKESDEPVAKAGVNGEPSSLKSPPVSWPKPHLSPSDRPQDLILSLLRDDRPGAAWRLYRKCETNGTIDASTAESCELKGDVLMSLQSWEEASKAYSSISDQTLRHKATLASELSRQSKSGPNPDGSTVASVYHSHLSSEAPRIPVADWLSTSLKVAKIPNAGRGLITTRAVPAGETLLVAKSRGSSYPSDGGLANTPILRCNFENGVLSTTTQVLATTNLIHIMIDRPEVAQEILGLTAGPGTPDSPWVQDEVFEKARAAVDDEQYGLAVDRIGPKGGINSLYVDEVLRHNAFGPGLVSRQSDSNSGPSQTCSLAGKWPRSLQTKLDRDPPNAFQRSTQPHPLPAILNHSCLPNVSSIFLGDVVITKALRPLLAGEEITHEYVRGGTDYSTRQQLLSKHGFTCTCSLCKLDFADGETLLANRRRTFAVQVPAIFSRSDALLSRSKTVLEIDEKEKENHQEIREDLQELEIELNATYNTETRGDLRPEMRDVLERIARHTIIEGRIQLGIQYFLRSLLSVNAKLSPTWDSQARKDNIDSISSPPSSSTSLDSLTVEDMAITESPAIHVDEAQRTIWRLSQTFLYSGNQNSSLQWSHTAYNVHDILIGGGISVFKDRWGPTNEQERNTLEWIQAWDLWERNQHV